MGVIERAKLRVEYSRLRFRVMAGMCIMGVGIHEADGWVGRIRDRLPEPVDLPDHTGNMTVSAPLGYVIGHEIGKRTGERTRSERWIRTVGGGAAFVAGVAAAALCETVGQRVPGSTTLRPDITDAIYGTVAATLAGYFGPDVRET